MVHRHAEPNVYDIKLVNGKGPVCTVNQCQLQDNYSKDFYASHLGLQVPSYNPSISRDKSPLKVSHPYATH